MALTLRGLAAERALGIRVLTGEDALDRPIGWVHPTELTDPQAFLEGGELLLTTGLALDEQKSGAYVRRLVDAGVAGLGFGVGLSHERVPRSLVETAAEVGLPVLEVPRETPFIAITRAVSRSVAADEYAATFRIGRGQQELTRTAVGKGGAGGVVRRLARLIDGWVLLFDASDVTEASSAAARAYGTELREELERLRSGTRVAALGEYEVVLQTLDTRARRVLAVGTKGPLDPAGRHITNTAVSLLSLALEQNRAQSAALRRLRTGLAELLADGQAELAGQIMKTLWGGSPQPPWTVLVATGPAAARRTLVDLLEAEEQTLGEEIFFAESGAEVLVAGHAAGGAARWAAGLAARVGLPAGLSEPTADFAVALRQAGQAAAAAKADDVPLVSFAEHTGQGLLGLLEPEAAQAFADSLLAPLRQHDETGRGDLVDSLKCWLEHHGHWDNAATRLGIHRHTLRNRIRRAGELLSRDLDTPGARAELWVAIQVQEG